MSSPGDERSAEGRGASDQAPSYPTGHPSGRYPQAPSGQPPAGGPAPGPAPDGQPPGGGPAPGPIPYGPQYGQPPAGGPAPGSFPYGQPPYAGPAGNAPAEPPHVYDPYGNFPYPASYPAPAGLGPESELPPRRPGSLHLALLLVVVSALPYLFVGLLAVAGATQAAGALPPDDSARFEQAGIDVEQFVRGLGFVILAIAVAYTALGVLAWTGRRWARALLAATTAGFVLMAVASVVAAGSQGLALDGASLLVLVVPLVIAATGVGLMFGGAARDWFAHRR